MTSFLSELKGLYLQQSQRRQSQHNYGTQNSQPQSLTHRQGTELPEMQYSFYPFMKETSLSLSLSLSLSANSNEVLISLYIISLF